MQNVFFRFKICIFEKNALPLQPQRFFARYKSAQSVARQNNILTALAIIRVQEKGPEN